MHISWDNNSSFIGVLNEVSQQSINSVSSLNDQAWFRDNYFSALKIFFARSCVAPTRCAELL